MLRHLSLLLLALLSVLAAPVSAMTQESRVVRVGVFPMPGFNRIEDNVVTGYNFAYLEQVSKYTGWTLAPVVLNNWTEAQKALDEDRIDLLGPTLHSPEREKRYLFCLYPSGTTFTALVTLSKNTALTYEDFPAFAGLRIGTARAPFWRQNFASFARRNDFSPPPLQVFVDMEDARHARRHGGRHPGHCLQPAR